MKLINIGLVEEFIDSNEIAGDYALSGLLQGKILIRKGLWH